MQIFSSLAELRELKKPVHWAMGFFDGVHLGHAQVVRSASTPGALRGVLTFQQHPLALLCPERQPRLLTPDPAQKAALLEALGVDVLLCLPFTPEVASLPPEDFLRALRGACPLAGVSVGANWRFGRGGVGDTAFLRQYAAAHGFPAVVRALVEKDGQQICSSLIRRCLQAGELGRASALLGRPFCLVGTVEQGQHLARQLGFPTANITLPRRAALPPLGVYEVQAQVGGELLLGVANLGLRPTIQEEEKPVRLESHFLRWQGDLYGRRLCVELRRFLRPEQRFDSLEALREQMQRDLARVSPASAGAAARDSAAQAAL